MVAEDGPDDDDDEAATMEGTTDLVLLDRDVVELVFFSVEGASLERALSFIILV